jgi:hypothetical protein
MRVVVEGRACDDPGDLVSVVRDRFRRALGGAAAMVGPLLVRLTAAMRDGRFVRHCVVVSADDRVHVEATSVVRAIERAAGRLGARARARARFRSGPRRASVSGDAKRGRAQGGALDGSLLALEANASAESRTATEVPPASERRIRIAPRSPSATHAAVRGRR